MINRECFTRDWILQKRAELGTVDPTLLEKSILAFELLSQLREQNINFIFKGGTSLLLLLKDFKRLSIDVDIFFKEPFESLPNIFNKIVDSSPFIRWEEDTRSTSRIPKKHFKFYFQSAINNREDYVLLDVLRGRNIFPGTQSVPIEMEFFECDSTVNVKVPTIDSLLGDKLTAFAPTTVGIPYKEYRPMQIIKQLFDLGELFQYATNIKEISDSYNAFLELENGYRRKNYSRDKTLQDTINACYLISQLRLRRGIENTATDILHRGISQIGSHLINRRFNLDDAKIAASRTAYLAKTLQTNSELSPDSFHFDHTKVNRISDVELKGDLQILNRLKPILPEAFYYWHLVSGM